MEKVEITTNGIKQRLKSHDVKEALCEYIWNGFDAGASKIEISYEANPLFGLDKLSITDNGWGIQDSRRFKLFLESHKNQGSKKKQSRSSSKVKGQDGIGRLSFFKFAERAVWETTTEEQNVKYRYTIEVDSNNLDRYQKSDMTELDQGGTGTKVSFFGLKGLSSTQMTGDIAKHLCFTFAWLLELNKEKKYAIHINGEELDYSNIIYDSEKKCLEIQDFQFTISLILWKQKLKDEYSRYYFLNNSGEELYTETTKLNNKSDNFHHSLYIESSFFEDKDSSFFNLSREGNIFSQTRDGQVYDKLIKKIESFLSDRRRNFLKRNAENIIEKYEKSSVFPKFTKNSWNNYRESQLKEFVKELYVVEPKIFSNLNVEQKKIFVRFINLIIESDEQRDKVIDILGEVVNLSTDDLECFHEILQRSKLSSIVKTINLIQARCEIIAQLKELVFNKSLKANEVKHLQGFIENHYWIFGEQYHLVTSAEPKFDEALRRFVRYHKGQDHKVIPMDHPDKNREMDIFMTRQIVSDNSIQNVVVELKHPTKLLGEKEVAQIKRYQRVLESHEQFNGDNMTWQLILVGNRFDTSNYIEGELENCKNHGKKHLIFCRPKFEIYCRTWSEIFTDFEIRYNHILNVLKLERDNLISSDKTADDILKLSSENTARKS